MSTTAAEARDAAIAALVADGENARGDPTLRVDAAIAAVRAALMQHEAARVARAVEVVDAIMPAMPVVVTGFLTSVEYRAGPTVRDGLVFTFQVIARTRDESTRALDVAETLRGATLVGKRLRLTIAEVEQMCSSQEMAEQVRSAVAGERSALDSVDGLMRSIDILGKEMAELRDTLGKIASLYNGFVNGEPRPDWAADQVLAAIGAALGPPWQDSPVSRT